MSKVYTVREAEADTNSNAGAFFLKLLHSATNTHIYHLQTTSYAQHVALGDYYDSVVDLTDGLIEAYQGTKGIVRYPSSYDAPLADGLTELKVLNDFIIANRNVIGTESNLQNEVDTILNLVQATIYKLTNLK